MRLYKFIAFFLSAMIICFVECFAVKGDCKIRLKIGVSQQKVGTHSNTAPEKAEMHKSCCGWCLNFYMCLICLDEIEGPCGVTRSYELDRATLPCGHIVCFECRGGYEEMPQGLDCEPECPACGAKYDRRVKKDAWGRLVQTIGGGQRVIRDVDDGREMGCVTRDGRLRTPYGHEIACLFS